ncbi:phosphate import ATP-binding protein PstB 2 [Algimonas arctica]|uniref:Phosphate import ATP-binding protein PstB 2 n=1 Tax=Algimonas arctica TaxID=1479486 RepID=A0A8J3G2C3_9PROT|nr:phosphate ABC transporter ATP-binding protein [Algimonas arctica]GHA93601.1 phosphate import ATP-binding protein PstB 2 [Algimonas arctica]
MNIPNLLLVSSNQSSDVDVQSHSIRLDGFSAYYGKNCIVSDINLKLPIKGVTCLVGPSGAGKSTILRWLNRINEETESASFSGTVKVLGRDIMSGYPDVTELRRRVGMVFQQPCVFPCSIYDNILMGLRTQKLSKAQARDIVEHGLKLASLWDEVSNRLEGRADSLSLGQQQRLCLARALVLEPDVLLLDEPTASIDPISSHAIEELVISLGRKISIVMVTHNIGQAKRISDHVVFLCDGKIVEQGTRAHMFSPRCSAKTKTYITEDFCDC